MKRLKPQMKYALLILSMATLAVACGDNSDADDSSTSTEGIPEINNSEGRSDPGANGDEPSSNNANSDPSNPEGHNDTSNNSSGACSQYSIDQCPPRCTPCPNGCVNTTNSVNNCGSCGYTCEQSPDPDATTVCEGGSCVTKCPESMTLEGDSCVKKCAESMTLCNGSCVDLWQNDEHCGECGRSCETKTTAGPEVKAVCERRICVEKCPGSKVECYSDCYDLSRSDSNCGRCHNECHHKLECIDGKCQCPSGGVKCVSSDGVVTCANLSENYRHCGECNRSCEGTCGDYDCDCENGKCVKED